MKTLIALCLLLTGSALYAQAPVAVPTAAEGLVPQEAYDRPARFRVTPDVLTAGVPAATATIGSFGNNLLREAYSFEGQHWRSQWTASADGVGRVEVGPALSNYNTLADGFLDGGFVRVYRVVEGRMTLVHAGRIPEGGFVLRGWRGGATDRMISAGADRFLKTWADWEHPTARRYFAVASVGRNGKLSERSAPVGIAPPGNFRTAPRPGEQTQALKIPRKADEQKAPPVPQGLEVRALQNGQVELAWQPVASPNLAGYVLYETEADPQAHEGFFIRLEDATLETKAGDMVIAGTFIEAPLRDRMIATRIFGEPRSHRSYLFSGLPWQDNCPAGMRWRLVDHEPGTPVQDPGKTYAEITLEADASFKIERACFSGTDQNWYEVLEPGVPYQVECWLKGDGGQVVFSTSARDIGVQPISFTPGPQWQHHVGRFQVNRLLTPSTPQFFTLTINGPGTIAIDNYRIRRADVPYLDYSPREYARLRESGIRSLRTHGPIKTGTSTYSMDQFTNDGGAVNGISFANGLPHTLRMMRQAAMIPWLQIEFHMSPEEWAGLVEYLAAPYEAGKDTPQAKPWAWKRVQQGQKRPWVEEFPHFYFELSNETWNGLFSPWTFKPMPNQPSGAQLSRGAVYGLFQEHVRDLLRASPYWGPAGLDERVTFVIGGWSRDVYGWDAARHSPHSRFTTIAAYNGGWDEGEGPPQVTPTSFFNVLTQVVGGATRVAQLNLGRWIELMDTRTTPLHLGVYEAGPGYALDGLNNAVVTREQARQQEEVMKSLAAGTATLDSFLARAAHGFVLENFFTFEEGTHWKSHAKWYRGGQAYPSWLGAMLFNRHAVGDLLQVETLGVPAINLPKVRRRDAVKDAPLVGAYASRQGDRVSLFLCSRKIPGFPKPNDDGFVPVTAEVPFTGARTITLFRMTGDHQAHNIDAERVKIETIPIPVSAFNPRFTLSEAIGASNRGLPPASTFVYVFEGVEGLPEGKQVDPASLLPQAP